MFKNGDGHQVLLEGLKQDWWMVGGRCIAGWGSRRAWLGEHGK